VSRTSLLALSSAVVLLVACGPSEEVVDFGAEPDDQAPVQRDVIDVHDVEAPDQVPPPDARLFQGGWEEAAAFVAREAEEGRPTLVNIFASWCVPCRTEMPMLVEASREHTDVAFLGIDHIDRLEDGEQFVEDYDVTFPTIHDIDGDVAFAVGSRGMPTTVVFDRDGVLVGRVIGELTDTSLRELLDQGR
jgi:thiol-disulfide isomerase/thioredoxin